MADNTTLNAGTGGDTLRDVDKGGVKTPVVTLDLGGAGAESLIAGAMPVAGTFWQATQPVSAAALPLPAGAATSAKQPALGTAGAAAADVLTIQGIASMVAVKVDGSAATQPVSGTVGISGSVAVTGTFWQATQPVSLAALPLPTGAATAAKQPALGTAGAAAADVLTIQGIAAMVALKVDGSAVTQPVSGTVAATPAAAASGGATPYHLVSAASTNATSVKGSAGVLYALSAFNTNASARFLKLFDKASVPVPASDTPVLTFLIPPSNGGFTLPIPVGIQFSSGIALAITGGVADNDNTAVVANDVVVNLTYK